jgi:sec-independent protein translocase protein TatC
VLEFVPVQVGTQSFLTLQLTSNAVVAAQLDKGPGLVYIDPATPFMSSLHIAFYGGIVLVAPFLFFFLGQYIVPALRWKEKKYFLRAFGIGLGLFLLGVCFCYFWMAPVALRAAEQYSLWMGIDVPEWRAETYFSFLCKFMLGMGLGFEMPVVLLALVKIGILDYQKLAGFRRYMIVINLILGAVLTTPEVVTQLLMFVPLQLLYEVSIWIAWYWERREKKRAAAEAKAGGGEVE